MAVIRTRKESDPSGEVPSGPGGGPTPVDRTRSVVKTSPPAARRTRTPGRSAIPGASQAATAAGDSRSSFVQDTIAELKRVEWPSKEKVRAGTIVTIGLLVFFSLYIFGLDYLAEQFFMLLGFYGK